MIVCPVSSSVFTLKEGSSRANLWREDPQFFKIALCLWFDGNGDDRIREVHRFENDRLFFTADRIPGRRIFETHGGEDISGRDLLNLLPLVGMHLQQTADPFSLSLWSD